MALRPPYPPLEPYRASLLPVSPVHTLYYEESGNPLGKPVLFIHGGPGGGTEPRHRRFFDPTAWRIVLFDQRGCGKSRPHASLEENATPHLVEDIERLRQHLGIDQWTLFGGSWGSTLALAYAEAHPDRVTELVLRGIFLLRRWEIAWFYQEGASRLFPEAWEDYLAPIPREERGDLLNAYYRRLTDPDPFVRQRAARAWSIWEGRTSTLLPDPELIARSSGDEFSLAFARIECHYFVHGAFFEREDQLLEDLPRIRHLPAVIVQGRYDVVCPAQSAFELHRAWPGSRLVIIPDAGHSANEPGITSALVEATDRFRR
jgi:proline iminopeptidase